MGGRTAISIVSVNRTFSAAQVTVHNALPGRLPATIGIETDADAERLHADVGVAQQAAAGGIVPDRERIWLGMLYEALTWLQDSLIAFVMGEEDDDE